MFLIASIFCNYWEARYHLDSYIKTSRYRGASSIHEGDRDRRRFTAVFSIIFPLPKHILRLLSRL